MNTHHSAALARVIRATVFSASFSAIVPPSAAGPHPAAAGASARSVGRNVMTARIQRGSIIVAWLKPAVLRKQERTRTELYSSLSLSLYIYIYGCMHACMYVYIYRYIHTYVHTYIYIYVPL